ncbi:MAG TPA: CocE/NonD family hydrolase [Dehalococcoidia bacterium]|nr:CocE/NonD family hydrolase [Dehalococcoidia bacterium]
MAERITKKEKFGDVELECIYRETNRPSVTATHRFSFCPPFNQRTYVAEDGIICEQDVAIRMRDGITIYTDIYRPVGAINIPVIISWSPFGKRPGDVESEWQIMGVPPGAVSRMAKFESADPGYWCHRGYAIANVDPRGVGHSEGDANIFGTQDGRDGYDFIEWVAAQVWCNGRVGMFGNSGVAMVQWRIAAEQPPHLTCIAPWEGTGDLYRESLCEGGIPGYFCEGILSSLAGQAYVDDTIAMAKKYPLLNAYWEDKIPKWENIRIPTYTTVCWSHIHLRGSMEGFRKIRSTKKWLRAHREFEWADTYSPAGLGDLQLFFDRYLKDIRNGWELTPRIRLEVMDTYEYDFQTDRPEKEFPLARTRYKKLYLDAAKGSLSFEPAAKESRVSYESKEGLTTFDITFNEDTEITGYMKLRLWVQADGHDDMDMFINIRKLDGEGNWLPVHVMGEPYPGAKGLLRVSHRELDEKLSTDFQPVQAHRKKDKLKPAEIVPVDIEIWPHSRFWHKGQQLRVIVSGHYISEGWFLPSTYETDNKGNHVIHTGGKYDSYLQIPVIPPRYQAGNYIYR